MDVGPVRVYKSKNQTRPDLVWVGYGSRTHPLTGLGVSCWRGISGQGYAERIPEKQNGR